MAKASERKKRTKRVVAQAKTVAHQWTGVLAENFGLRDGAAAAPAPACALDRAKWESAELAACWLGHATTLLRIGGVTILTDPHFDERAGVRIASRKIGRKRTIGVPIAPESLPSVDVLLLSHAHMDHWDKESLETLSGLSWASRTVAFIPVGTRKLLPSGFGTVIELGWEHQAQHAGVLLRAIRPRHWGARFILDRKRGYNAYVLEHAGRRVLFGGDTAHTHAFDHLGKPAKSDATKSDKHADAGHAHKVGVDLAVMGIGSYEPWHDQHATPEQVADMARQMKAELLMPIHHATFEDSNVPLDEPLARLLKAWDADRLVCRRVGDVWYA